jgi:aldehyde dehydrogenase
MEKAVARTKAIVQGDPLDPATMIGAQASSEQLEKIMSYMDIGRQEGAEVLTGGGRAEMMGELAGGYYVQPTIFKGHNKMRIFQEEIFGPVVSVTTFKDEDEALHIANDTLYGLGAGVWSREANTCYRFGRAIQAGRVWTNCYHAYPAHAAFGGYKQSGHRAREPPRHARPLSADQEHAGQLLAQEARVLLGRRGCGGPCGSPALLCEVLNDRSPRQGERHARGA